MDKETLAIKAQAGDREVLAQLWEAVRPLLYGLAYRFYTHYGADTCARHGVTLDDLRQETYFALLDAVRAYQPEKGFQLTTFQEPFPGLYGASRDPQKRSGLCRQHEPPCR